MKRAVWFLSIVVKALKIKFSSSGRVSDRLNLAVRLNARDNAKRVVRRASDD